MDTTKPRVIQISAGIFILATVTPKTVPVFLAAFNGEPKPRLTTKTEKWAWELGERKGREFDQGILVVDENLFLYKPGGSGQRPALEQVELLRQQYDFPEEVIAAYMTARGEQYAPRQLPELPKQNPINIYANLPTVTEILAFVDYDTGGASCPHCGAIGRYVYRFLCADGQEYGAMRGCFGKFPKQPDVWSRWFRAQAKR